MMTTQSLQLQGLRKTLARGLLYLRAPLSQTYGTVQASSAFLLVIFVRVCVFHTLFILLFSFLSTVQLLEAWGPSAKGQKRQKCGQQNKAIIGSSPILYTQSAVSAGKTITS